MAVRVLHGDMREQLQALIAEGVTVQSIVTDPPYGLAFMGKHWDAPDNVAFQPETWRLCFDLLPPGGHLLAFAGTRTYHRMACAIEDAGFELRDTIAWLYGSGFPKSHNVSKGIDRAAGAEREVIGPNSARHGGGNGVLHGGGIGATVGDITAPATAAARQWDGWGTALKPAMELICVARKPLRGTVAANVLEFGTGGLNIDACRIKPNGQSRDSSGGQKKPGGDRPHELRGMWDADGEMEKPSEASPSPDDMRAQMPLSDNERTRQSELAGRGVDGESERLPLSEYGLSDGSGQGVASDANAAGLFGTSSSGGEGARAGSVAGRTRPSPERGQRRQSPGESNADELGGTLSPASRDGAAGLSTDPHEHHSDFDAASQGRWPANVVTDGSAEVVKAFPESASTPRTPSENHHTGRVTTFQRGSETSPYFDEGSAARFFYSARPDDEKRFWYGSKADGDDRLQSRHPTIKPTDLVRWLVRLVTPPGGTVLDPFAGSGTTGMACMAEGFDCILVERELEYVKDIHARIAHVHGEDTPLFAALNPLRDK